MKTFSERKFIFASNSSSMSVMKYDINLFEVEGKPQVEVQFCIQHGAIITIHSSSAVPLNAYTRKLIRLRKLLQEAADTLQRKSVMVKREWLDKDLEDFSSSFVCNVREDDSAFVEISDCLRSIRFNSDNPDELRLGLSNIALFIMDLCGVLVSQYKEFFIDLEELDKRLPALRAEFSADASLYNWRTREDFEKSTERYALIHSRGDKEAYSTLFETFEILSDELWENL